MLNFYLFYEIERTDSYMAVSTEYLLRHVRSMPIWPGYMCRAQFVRKRRAVWREHFCHKLLKLAGCCWHGVVYLANVITFFLNEGFRWFDGIVCSMITHRLITVFFVLFLFGKILLPKYTFKCTYVNVIICPSIFIYLLTFIISKFLFLIRLNIMV